MRTGKWLTAIALALLAGVWGLCSTLGPSQEPAAIQAVAVGSEDGEAAPVLRPGECTDSSLSFRNQSLAGCKLRVRVCVPTVEGEPVLEAGHMTPGGFVGSGGFTEDSGEYWTAKGAYLYYKNSRTGDFLPPGKETPPLYTAVRLNPLIGQEALTALRDISPQQQLYVLAQARDEGEGPWQETVVDAF